MSDNSTVDAPILKLVSAWGAAWLPATWGDLAAALASVYTFMLIAEWIWKKYKRLRHGSPTP